jgi:hypothetical protein
MGRLIALLLGGFGIFAFLRRRRHEPEPIASPADELRSKLAETRAGGEAPVPEPDLAGDLEARRREVHDRARGAIDDLS